MLAEIDQKEGPPHHTLRKLACPALLKRPFGKPFDNPFGRLRTDSGHAPGLISREIALDAYTGSLPLRVSEVLLNDGAGRRTRKITSRS